MQLSLSFSLLLASLLLAISSSNVEALPAKRNAGMVTLPLKRLHQPRSDIHPQVLLQQHINRGRRRLARMTGRAEPSQEELRADLHKRVYLLDHEPRSRRTKRFNRHGVPKFDALTAGSGNGGKKAAAGVDVAAALGGGFASDTGDGGADSGAAASNATSNSTNPGVSPLDIQAIASDTVTPANAPTANNSLGLAIEANDVGYLATVSIGTPPRDFNVIMDSGSADFWVGSENCQAIQEQTGGGGGGSQRRSGGGGAAAQSGQDGASGAEGCGNHTFLGSQSSSSFVDTQQPFQVTYGSGEVAGTIVQDNVNLAGLALNNHTFGTAQQETIQFTGAPVDGLMGLAQSTLSEQKTLTPVESLAQNGLINDAITSFKISRLADQKNDGEVTFGGLDQTKFDPATLTTFANVNENGFWEGAMADVTVNGQDTGLTNRTAILDTGTTVVIAPPQDAAAVHQGIAGAQSDGQGGFTVPCTTTDSVALTFGGTSFAIDPRDLAQAPVDPQDPTGDCTSGISSGTVGNATEWLVGDVFLKNAYFSTDVGKNQISLAKLV